MEAAQHMCDHTCPRDCHTLNELLLRETSMLQSYEQLLTECDFPEIRRFVLEMIEVKRRSIRNLEQRINAVYGSFDPAGC